MGVVADIRRALVLARTPEFECPGCHRTVLRDALIYAVRRACCPLCGAVVLAPPGHPVGYVPDPQSFPVASTPPPAEPSRLGFLPAAFWGALALYLFWMLPGALRVAAIGYLGWRPTGLEATAVTILGVIAGLALAFLALGMALSSVTHVPGVLGTAATIAAVVVPLAAFHGFIVLPWSARMAHADDWPAAIALVGFEVCADRFDLGADALAADGVFRLEIENRSEQVLLSATFTVKTGESSDWLDNTGEHRVTVRNVGPGGRARIEQRSHLGRIMWAGGNDSGGPGAAPGQVLWDSMTFADRHEPARVSRPPFATIPAIADCPGVKRPPVPWYRPPYQVP